ncbi:Quinol monooxygenase YgiN [Modestobacter sp. DSM 44400]|uniref:putative quinol monooxygenase n=1 Tax=Modestobacter sp. DSM 44400 TaxID=1550230 RepID=UPI000899B779|nr:putative quinol monooxygenase [Modestobacter sp. DSM 44400]SDY32777.1 Quinol monooxygenase YgiN [Modestobacter sp. DSM 44400]
MIFIVVKWTIRPDRADEWLTLVDDFTRATRAEEGNLFFEWSRSVDEDNVFTLVEAFRDADAGAAHVQTDHFRTAIGWMGDLVTKKPDIVNVEVPQDGWGEMGEVSPPQG